MVKSLLRTKIGFNRYSYCLNNPLKYTDPTGQMFSPYYDKLGNFLGVDENGFKGDIYITTKEAFNASANKDRIADSKILQANKDTKELYGFRNKLTKNALDDILNHVVSGTKLPYGEGFLREGTFNVNRTNAATSNGMYNGKVNGIHQMDFSASDYEWTVENIRGLATHEIWGHGIKGYGDKTKNHHLIYQGQMDSPYWGGSTDRYKSHTVDTYYNYFYYEKGTNIVPDPYYSKLLKHLKIKP